MRPVKGAGPLVGPVVSSPGSLGRVNTGHPARAGGGRARGTGARERRLRLLPTRVVMYFVLAFAFFERSSYQASQEGT
ncbi:transposase domain-containing protein [Streptacidiphilus carbonis]|uniref:transposase domain-containing protein n=1 Tax=Streptacidiphilus carbonis TaxID=105422 RepID=UPI0034E1D39E